MTDERDQSKAKKVALVVLAGAIGAFSNRVLRGSGFFKPADVWNGVAYALFVFLYSGYFAPGSMLDGFMGVLGASDLQSRIVFALVAGVAMFLVMSPGWGAIWGAIGGARGNWFEGVYKGPAPIVWLCRPLEGRVRLWGWTAGVLRGLIVGAPLAVLFGPLALVAGLLMPVAYFTGATIEQVFFKRNGFEASEIVFGLILWASTIAERILESGV